MKKYLASLFVIIHVQAFSQDISGNWQGVLYQGGAYFPYSMQLIQTGIMVTGVTKIKLANTNFFGTHSISSGIFISNTFNFQTVYTGGQAPPSTFWCSPQGNLVYYNTIEKMQGPWMALSCSPGTIEVWRLKLISDSIFCEGQPINLAVTGQNIRWYRDSSLATLLATGNSYSPVINSTTNFYVTQTHYNTESPLLPVKVIIKPKSYAYITQSICEGNTFMGHSTSGVYTDTLVNYMGCDSIRRVTLIVNARTFSTINQSLCEGDTFLGHTASGAYIDTLVNSRGCDSIRTVNLTVKFRIRFSLNHTICEGNIFLGYYSTGIYYDTFTVANNCDSIRILNLTVLPFNRRKISKRICEGEHYFAGGIYQTISGMYYDTIHSNIGCDSIVETTLMVSPLPHPDLGPDKKICTGDSALLNAGSYSTYLWSNGTTLPTLKIKGPGIFWVNVSNSYGCNGADTITVLQIDCRTFQIPNVYSPNGDGINDTWIIPELQGYPDCRVQIFDRYRKQIFNGIGYSKPWDGKYQEKELPIGTYYYIINFSTHSYTGSVLIIR